METFKLRWQAGRDEQEGAILLLVKEYFVGCVQLSFFYACCRCIRRGDGAL